ncbi:MAG: aromatic hydrocarbon degradation protein [bacterium]
MIKKTIKSSFIILFSSSFIASPLLAEADHYKNILVGDKAATMGGTYVGISNDISGTYYNPAGIAYSNGTGVSASANVYHAQKTTYKGAIRNLDWNRSSAQLLPNFFGLMKTWGDHTLAFSVVVPDSFVQHQDQVYLNLPATSTQPSINRYVFNLHSQDESYLIGPSYAYKYSEKFSIGTTLSYFYRKSRMQSYQEIWLSGGETENSTVTTDWGENGIAPKIGFKWSPTENFSAGLTLFHTFIFSSNFSSQNTSKVRTSNDPVFDEFSTKSKRGTGTQISLGVAYKVTDKWLIASDIDFNIAPPTDAFFPYGYQGVVNYSFGTEYTISKRHAVRAGFFTNQSNMNEPDNESSLITHINMYGVAAGYTYGMDSTSITLGLIYSAGSGKAQVYEDIPNTISVTRYTLTGVLATSYSF